MSLSQRIQRLLRASLTAPQQTYHYLAEAAMRLFSRSSDRYPATGVQPFTGTVSKKTTHPR